MNTGNIVLWEIQHNNADLDCFKTLIMQGTFKTQHQHQVEFCAFPEAEHLSPSVGCAKKKKTQFHTVFTEAEVISLDAGLRMDGILALDLTKPNHQNQR